MFNVQKFACMLVAGTFTAAIPAGVASAATFDFQRIADGNGTFNTTTPATLVGSEGDWASVVGGSSVGIVNGGISVVASGIGNDGLGGTSTVLAYFDSASAGLGVCGALSGGECSPSDDDNVGATGGTANAAGPSFETLVLTFSTLVKATSINLAGYVHSNFLGTVIINGVTFGPGAPDFSHVGSDYSTLTASALAALGASKVWTFQYVPTNSVVGTDEFYIDSISVASVPVPAGGLLLIGALGGLAALRRRKMAA